MIQIEKLRKEYGSFVAVDDVSLHVPKGAVLALVGPNGAGKTTLMKMIVGLMPASSGSAKIDGHSEPRKVHSLLGFLPDFFGIYNKITVREYLEYFALAYDITDGQRQQCIERAIAAVQLEAKADELLEKLSRGMRQRAGIARCLINDPPVLLLDEPAAGLDPEARHLLQNLFIDLSLKGKTLIVSSHILTELEEYCSHVAFLQKGKLMASGAISEVRAKAHQGRRIQLRVHGESRTSLNVLTSMNNVSDISEKNYALLFTFMGSDLELSNLVKKLVEGGVQILSFGEEHGRIQDAYLSLMKGHSE